MLIGCCPEIASLCLNNSSAQAHAPDGGAKGEAAKGGEQITVGDNSRATDDAEPASDDDQRERDLLGGERENTREEGGRG